jgi:hypothetical protein
MNFVFLKSGQTKFKSGATKPVEVTLQDSNKQPVNLTGATVKVRVATDTELILERLVTIKDAAKGVVELGFSDTEQFVVGSYNIEFRVVYSSGTEEIFPDSSYLKIQVMKSLSAKQNSFEVTTDFTKLKKDLVNIQTNVNKDIANKASQAALDVEKARINNLIATAGNVSGNSELVDLRVGADGKTYTTAGEAIRNMKAGNRRKIETYTDFLDDNTTGDYSAWMVNNKGYFHSTFDMSQVVEKPSLNVSASIVGGLGFMPSSIDELECYVRVDSTTETTQSIGTLFNYQGSWGGATADQVRTQIPFDTNRWVKFPLTQQQIDACKANPNFTTQMHLVFDLSQLKGSGSFKTI